jgi:hypothetical protein
LFASGISVFASGITMEQNFNALLLPFMMLARNDGNASLTAIVSLIMLLIPLIPNIIAWIKNALENWRQQNEVTVSGIFSYRNGVYDGGTIPHAFIAIQYRLSEEIKARAQEAAFTTHIQDTTTSTMTIMLLRPFEIVPGVMVRMKNEESEYKTEHDTYKTLEYTMILYPRGFCMPKASSPVGAFARYARHTPTTKNKTTESTGFTRVREFIDHCCGVYIDESIKGDKLVILRSCQNQAYGFDKYPFDTSKSFDNMFFEEKAAIKERLDVFMGAQSEYKRLGIPYTLGFMFHGAPGTGKTSTIKAIAKYTGRHVIILNPKNVKSMTRLIDMLYRESCGCLKIPIHKRLIVFEDIDCGGWQKVVSSRTTEDDSVSECSTTDKNELVDAIVSSLEKRPRKKASDEEDPITLGDLLEVLDGIMEMSGRMIIMTTNHPERLDPALIRPGRIDMVVEFKRMRRQDIADMYQLWFGEAIPESVYRNIPDNTFTQADIGNIFASRDRDAIFEKLN